MGRDWRPIEPLTSDWQKWADSEMAAIRVVWSDLRVAMVEDLYRWDRGVTETLLTHGVRADRIPVGASSWSPELVAQAIRDQIAAVEGLFA